MFVRNRPVRYRQNGRRARRSRAPGAFGQQHTALFERAEYDRTEHDSVRNDLPRIASHARQMNAVLDGGDDQSADQRAKDIALPASMM